MKKKKIIIPLIFFVIVIFAMVAFLAFGSNYKKEYHFDPNKDYYSITLDRVYQHNLDHEKKFNEKYNTCLENDETVFKGYMADVKIVIYKNSEKKEIKKTLKASTFKVIAVDKKPVRNFISDRWSNADQWKKFQQEVIANYSFVEYPLMPTKNYMVATYCKLHIYA